MNKIITCEECGIDYYSETIVPRESFRHVFPDIVKLETELADKEKQLAEARAEIENLRWQVNNEKAKSEAALELNGKALELVNEAQADAEHWKSECNALQRMVHEARAEIEKQDTLLEKCLNLLKQQKERGE